MEVDYNKGMSLKYTLRKSIAWFPLALGLTLFAVGGTASAAITADQGVASETVNINPNPQFAEGVPTVFKCLVCHADPKLKDDKVLKTLYFSRDDVMKSAHIKVGCAGCHSNYTTPPDQSHDRISKADSKVFTGIARASCVKCHDHDKQVAAVKASAHGVPPSADALTDQPTCLDCHEFHDMVNKKKDAAWAEDKHMQSKAICGKCHTAAYDSYNDYYHGRAYKAGDVRAPSCWDCHSNHDQMFGDEASSTISKQNLKKTCGKCHKNVDDAFLSYAPLIHNHKSLLEKNPLVSWIMGLIRGFLPKPALKIES